MSKRSVRSSGKKPGLTKKSIKSTTPKLHYKPAEHIINRLWDKDPKLRAKAIEELGQLGEAAVQPLMAVLGADRHSHDYEDEVLLQAIMRVGEPAFKALIAALKLNNPMVRAAAKTLQRTRNPRVVEPLITALLNEDIDPSGRAYIADALGTFKDPRAFEPLLTLLEHPDQYLRGHVAHALAEYGDPSLLPRICEALKDQDESWLYFWEGLPLILSTLKRRSVENQREQEFEWQLQTSQTIAPKAIVIFKQLRDQRPKHPLPNPPAR